MKEWFTSSELADMALPGLPETKSGIIRFAKTHSWADRYTVNRSPLFRQRRAKGGGMEYHYTVLPQATQMKLVARDMAARKAQSPAAGSVPDERGTAQEAWTWFDSLPDAKKAKARDRLRMLQAVQALTRGGLQKNSAVYVVARENGIAPRSIWNWFDLVAGQDCSDWLPYLCPRHRGGGKKAEMPVDAWEMFKADFLRPEQPTGESCYRRLKRIGESDGWELPALRTFLRRIETDVSPITRIYLREGVDRLKQLFPYMERDRSSLHALQGVNADGHKADVMVQWSDDPKDVGRPQIVVIQDLYSNKILSWRVDRSLTSTAVRLAFYDVFRDFGIPEFAILDNGREFAAKLITGGQVTRFRFKHQEGDPVGVLTALNIEVHWTMPYSGQSKPIERAFKDWAGDFAKDPRFDGAYTGRSPDNKPANYGARAVPIAEFLKVLAEYIAEANARTERRTKVCRGIHSFNQVFDASIKQSLVRRATEEQMTLAMLAAEQVTARRPDGSVWLHDSRFWAEFLIRHIGEKLTLRFDPEDIQAGVRVYRADGVFLGLAPCVEAGSFLSVDQARSHQRNRKDWMRAAKTMAKNEVSMPLADIVRHLPAAPAGPEPVAPAAVRLVASGGGRAMPVPQAQPEDSEELIDFRERLARGLKLVSDRLD